MDHAARDGPHRAHPDGDMVHHVAVAVSGGWCVGVLGHAGQAAGGRGGVSGRVDFESGGVVGVRSFCAGYYSGGTLPGFPLSTPKAMWGRGIADFSFFFPPPQEVEADRRGAFSSVEASWQSTFELCSYASTIVWARPDQFQWPVLLSCVAVFSAGGLYASFVRVRRGHLLHFSKCIEHRPGKGRQGHDGAQGYERLVQSPNV